MQVDDDILEIWTNDGADLGKNQPLGTGMTKWMESAVAQHEIPSEIKGLQEEYVNEAKRSEAEMHSLFQDLERQRRDLAIEELYVDKVMQQPVTCAEHAETLKNLQERLTSMKMTYQSNKSRFNQMNRLLNHQSKSGFRTLPCLCGNFQLRKLVGRGASSEVWQAYCVKTKSLVALKILFSVENAQHEFNNHQMVAANSRYAVSVYSLHFVTYQQMPYALMAMECMQCDLSSYLETHGPCSPLLARHILSQLVLATAYMHHNNMAHGDLKPGNIMVSDTEAVTLQLTDFHLSQPKSEPIIVGTRASPGYAPPEWYLFTTTQQSQLAGTSYEKFDIWSLGVIFFQCLFNRHPLGTFSSKEDLRQSMHSYSKLPGELSFPGPISDFDKTILIQCLQVQWDKRPCAMELLKLLQR